MEQFDLIIFDCDGTLVDSEELNCEASVLVLEDLGIFDYSVQTYLDRFTGLTLSASIEIIEKETGKTIPEDIRNKYVSKVAELQKTELKPDPETIGVLEKLKDKLKMCVGSNGERSNVMSSLHLSGFDPFFNEDNIFTKIQVERPKPYPDLFLFAAVRMGVSPEKTLVLEDSEAGVQAGKAAGMRVWGYTGTSHDPESASESLKKAGAEKVINRFIHIPELLGC